MGYKTLKEINFGVDASWKLINGITCFFFYSNTLIWWAICWRQLGSNFIFVLFWLHSLLCIVAYNLQHLHFFNFSLRNAYCTNFTLWLLLIPHVRNFIIILFFFFFLFWVRCINAECGSSAGVLVNSNFHLPTYYLEKQFSNTFFFFFLVLFNIWWFIMS